MNIKLLWILVIIAIVALGAWFAFGRTADMTGSAASAAPAANEETGEQPAAARTHAVTYTAEGFAPETLTVALGDTVEFRNESGDDMWVGADDHPTHTSYDGTSTREHCADGTNTNGSFDQCARSGGGTAWSYTFTKAGSFHYHNHARAADAGTIIVE